MGQYLFIRHGESDINVYGILSDSTENNSLTERGIKQARRTGEQLKGVRFDGIVSSPVRRAYETAKIISEYVNLDVIRDDRLREVKLGKANGHNINEFMEELYPNSHITGKIREELEMEGWEHLISRIVSCMDDYNGKYIFVSHSDPIRAAIAYTLNMDEGDTYGITVKNASITGIDTDKKKVLCIGSINLDDKIKSLFK